MTEPITEAAKIFVGFRFVTAAFSTDCAEENRAADAHQESEAVDDVPYRGDYSQGGRSFRAVVLADHGHIDNGIDRRDQGAAKGRSQIFKIYFFDIVV